MQVGEFVEALLQGKDRVISTAANRAWQDIPDTLRFCLAVGQSWNPAVLRRHQKRLIERSMRKIRERFEQLTPETVIQVAHAYGLICLNQSTMNCFAGVFLNSERGQFDRAVKLFELFHRARKLLWDDLGEENIRRYTYLHQMFGEVVCQAHRCPTWPNFVTAASKGHRQAVRVLEMLIYHYGSTATRLDVVPLSQLPPGELLNNPMDVYYILSGGNDTEIVRLPAPDAVAVQFRDLVISITQQLSQDQLKLNGLIEWFDHHEQQYLDHEAQMWHEIVHQPRYALRTAGADRIKLNVSALRMRQVRYTSLQLFPEQFPLARAKFWQMAFDQPVSMSFRLDPQLNSMNPDLVLERSDPRYPQTVVDRILYYIALHSYWKIVTGNLDSVMRVREVTEVRAVRQPDTGANVFRPFQLVRPHFRRLPEGYLASEEAIRLAAATIGSPPHGYTFVREHERGYQQVENLPPLFTYHDRDIGYEPEQPTAQ